MKSKRSQGAYYMNKTRKYYEKLGWKTEKLEVSIPFFIKGKILFSRKDLLASDIIIWKDKEVFLVQVKSTDGVRSGAIADVRLKAQKQFDECDIPILRLIVIWESRKKPLIEAYNYPH